MKTITTNLINLFDICNFLLNVDDDIMMYKIWRLYKGVEILILTGFFSSIRILD